MPTPTRAVEACVGMWNATDDRERRALAEEAVSEDAVLLYPTFEAHSRNEAVALAGRFQDDTHEARIEMLSGVEHHHGWRRTRLPVRSAQPIRPYTSARRSECGPYRIAEPSAAKLTSSPKWP